MSSGRSRRRREGGIERRKLRLRRAMGAASAADEEGDAAAT